MINVLPEPERRAGEIGGPRRPGPNDPKWRRMLWRVDWVWRRVVPLIAMALAAFALFGLSKKVDKNTDALTRQVEGRRIALSVLCGGLSGVEDAGRKILTGTLPPPAPQRSFDPQRRKVGNAYADAYARVISRRVLQQAGATRANDVLRKDGTVDCDRLKRESQAAPTPTP